MPLRMRKRPVRERRRQEVLDCGGKPLARPGPLREERHAMNSAVQKETAETYETKKEHPHFHRDRWVVVSHVIARRSHRNRGPLFAAANFQRCVLNARPGSSFRCFRGS